MYLCYKGCNTHEIIISTTNDSTAVNFILKINEGCNTYSIHISVLFGIFIN